jgi:hypothetical protein
MNDMSMHSVRTVVESAYPVSATSDLLGTHFQLTARLPLKLLGLRRRGPYCGLYSEPRQASRRVSLPPTAVDLCSRSSPSTSKSGGQDSNLNISCSSITHCEKFVAA